MIEDPLLNRRRYLAIVGGGLGFLSGCVDSVDQSSSTVGGNTAVASETVSRSAASAVTRRTTTAGSLRRTTAESTTTSGTPTATATDSGSRSEAVEKAEKMIATVEFEGSWFDTHAHWRMADAFRYEDYELETLTNRQREHDVGATVLFVPHKPMQTEYETSVTTLADDSVDYLPFLFPGDFSSSDQRRSYYSDHESVYHGLGEVTFYSGIEQGMALTDDPFPQYFQLSADEDLVLMLHPTEKQAGDIGPMLSEYPESTLLLHGFEMLGEFETLTDLLSDHDNLYWTYDTATMLGGLMVRARGKSDFLEQFEADRERYLKRVTDRLPQLLETAPNQVMWGTDVVADWHVDPDVYSRLITFSEEVKAALPEKHREPFAYGNAVSLVEA